jgi:phospholipid/cholesterol/gamma-HCH transport system substrate-binding protein
MFRRGMPVNPKIVGAVLLSTFLVALAFAFVSHAGLPGRHYRYATAAFDEVPASLRPGSDVRVDGVRIGQVHSVSYKGGEARVTFQLPGGTEVHRDATAKIRNRSALGQKYVDVDLGTAGAGPLGSTVLNKNQTVSLVELDQVLDALDPPTRAALASAVRELGGGIATHGRDLNDLIAASPDLLGDLGTTSAALSDPKARLVAFLQAAERLGARFTGRQAELEALVGHLGDTLAAVAADGGRPLQSSLEQAPGTLQALTPALRDLAGAAASTGAAARDLGPAAAALGAATPDLRGALREIVPTLRALPGVNGLAAPALGALATTLNDARPLAPAVRRGINLLSLPLEVLAPYAAELDLAADGLRDTTSGTDAGGNFLRIVALLVGADNLSTVLPLSSPGLNRNAYPTPGQAKTDGSRFSPLGTAQTPGSPTGTASKPGASR